MGIRIVTPPDVQPIEILGLAALKDHLNEAPNVSDKDELITTYCSVAWDYCQRFLWRQLLTAELRLTLPNWGRDCGIPLPRGPIISVESVEYFDADDQLQTVPESDWSVDVADEVPEVRLYELFSLADRPDAVRINFTAGYGEAAADFPPVLLHAVRLLVGQYYQTREPDSVNTTTVDRLLDSIALRDERLAEYC